MCNPQKGRFKTIDVEFTEENTTWFDISTDGREIYMITDLKRRSFDQRKVIRIRFRIYDMSRADIGYNQKKQRI